MLLINQSAMAICDRYIQAQEMVRDSNNYYEKISSTASQDQLRHWENQIATAEIHRMNERSVMDLLGANVTDRNSHITRQMGDEKADDWLSQALSLEERQ